MINVRRSRCSAFAEVVASRKYLREKTRKHCKAWVGLGSRLELSIRACIMLLLLIVMIVYGLVTFLLGGVAAVH